MDRKWELRRDLKDRLASMTAGEKARLSRRICERLAAIPEFSAARHVFAFMPLPVEPDILSLVAAHPEKRWSFPRVGSDSVLTFCCPGTLEEAPRGAFGIREPGDHCPISDPSEAGIILVPGLGFDSTNRARLGRGRGYYDRFLSGLNRVERPVRIIGLGFDIQLETLVSEPHDQPMDRIVTESGLY